MKLNKLVKLIKEELQKLIVENVVCDVRNNNPYTGVSSTCPSSPGGGSQTCVADFPPGPTGNEGTCGPLGGMTGGGTQGGGSDSDDMNRKDFDMDTQPDVDKELRLDKKINEKTNPLTGRPGFRKKNKK